MIENNWIIYWAQVKEGTHQNKLISQERGVLPYEEFQIQSICRNKQGPQVAGAWSERKKMFHGGSFLKLADDDV